jgi:hypothetical protein
MGQQTYKTHAAEGLSAVIAGNRKDVYSHFPIGMPDCRSTRFHDQQVTTDPAKVDCTKCVIKLERAAETARAAKARREEAAAQWGANHG